jgi:arylsulfatase A-like enzyme
MYVQMDREVGKIIGSAPRNVDVIVVSDHGFQAITSENLHISCQIKALAMIDALGARETLFGSKMGREILLWSTASSSAEREEVLERIVGILEEAHYIGDGAPVFDVAPLHEMLRVGVVPGNAREGADISLAGRTYAFEDLVSRIPHVSGTHHPKGVYLLTGPSVANARAADSLHVVDVAPTLAALLDLPVPAAWTGRSAIEGPPLRAALETDYPAPSGPEAPRRRLDEALTRKLRSLGYIE